MPKPHGFKLPRPRGFPSILAPTAESGASYPNQTGNPTLNDLIIHAAFCRAAFSDNSVAEFLTKYDKENGEFEIDIPDSVLNEITKAGIGPRLATYYAWLVGSLPNLRRETLQFTIGGASGITTGLKGVGLQVAADSTIERIDVFADTAGSIEIDIRRSTPDNYPPTALQSIVGDVSPTLVGANHYADTDLTNWEVDLNSCDVLQYYVNSVSGLSFVTVVLHVLRANAYALE